jgi:F5/8 type C domain
MIAFATVALTAATMAMLIAVSSAGAAPAKSVMLRVTKVSASSEQKANNVTLAVDGRARTRWVSASASYPQWLMLDLGRPRSVGYVKVVWYLAARRPYTYGLQGSVDRRSWSPLTSGMRARFVRVRITGTSTGHGWASIREVSVYSSTKPASTPTPTPTPKPTPTPTPKPTPTPTPTPTPAPIPRSTGPLNLNPPDGYVYNGGGVTSVSGTLSLGSNCTIVGVNFTSGGVRIRGNGNTIRGCTFGPNSWAALLIYVGSYNVIDGNTFNGKSGSGSCIQVLGGGHNQITNNVTHGGVTAIAFLYSRSVNGGGAASIIDGNVVTGNTCDGFSEEGITFDSLGNEPVDTGALDYDAIQSVSGSTVTLSSHAWPNYAGYYVIFMDGALQGRLDAITSVSGNSFTLANVPSGALAGNHVEIAAPFMNNEVAHNTVTGWCIKLYGLCFNNNVHDNTVNGAIEDESVDSLGAANISVTKQPGRAPNGYNTIQNNKVSGAITLEYYNIPDVVADPWPTAFQSMGNNVIGNTCASVQADDQYCYITGNSGGTKLSNVTLSPLELVP